MKIKLNIITSNDMKYPVTVDISEVDGLQAVLDSKANSVHTHPISAVTGLEAAITDLYSPLLSFPYGANDYKYPVISGVAPAANTLTRDILVWVPYFNPLRFVASSIGFRNWQNPGGFYRIGFYGMGSDGSPSDLLWDSGAIDASIPSWKDIQIPLTLNRGWYWIASVTSGSVQLILSQPLHYPLGIQDTGAVTPIGGYSISSVFANALPSIAPSKASLTATTTITVNTRIPYFRYR